MVIIDSALIVVMLIVTGYAALRLPRDARVPVHFGPGSFNNWVPKRIGLALWAAVGLAVFAFAMILYHRSAQDHGGALGLSVALAALIAVECGAIRAAFKRTVTE